jgi:recombination protein RecA
MADERISKNKAIDMALTQIEKQFGKGSIMRLGDRTDTAGVQSISTGCISFDAALGVGGFPKGRVVEIFGPESSGKTTIALHAIAQAQKAGGSAAFIDAEHAMDAGYSKMLGVNTDELLVSQPDNGEQALEIAEVLVRSGAIDILGDGRFAPRAAGPFDVTGAAQADGDCVKIKYLPGFHQPDA